MSHDRGCHVCFEDDKYDCGHPGCPYKERPRMNYGKETEGERRIQVKVEPPVIVGRNTMDLTHDSGDEYLEMLDRIGEEDADGLKKAQKSYGNSWKSRGGVGAFMMLARKWDRLQNRLEKDPAYDIFKHVIADQRAEGVIDDIRDLRRYLMLVEAELRARGFDATHRDNAKGA